MVIVAGAIFFVCTCESSGLAPRHRSLASGMPLCVFYGYFLAVLCTLVTCYGRHALWTSRLYVQREEQRLSTQTQAVGFLKLFFEVLFFSKCDGVFDFGAVSVLKGRSTLTVCVTFVCTCWMCYCSVESIKSFYCNV